MTFAPLPRADGRPLVLVPACNRMLGELCYHVAASKYVDAVRLAGCQPLVVPSVAPPDVDALLDVADGLLLTGSPSNVHPSHYDENVLDESLPLDPARDAWIHSLHGQGVNRLAPRLRVEARAPDGLVEAFSVPDAAGFALAVRWHPEWHAADNPVSMRLLGAFGDAARAHRQRSHRRDHAAEARHAPA